MKAIKTNPMMTGFWMITHNPKMMMLTMDSRDKNPIKSARYKKLRMMTKWILETISLID